MEIMSSESNIPKYIPDEEACADEYKELLSTLPKKPWYSTYLYQYQGSWFLQKHAPGVISFQKHFQPQHSDIFLVTLPKSGTTWIKAMAFALVHRKQYPPLSPNHPLLTQPSHHLVPNLEILVNPHTSNLSPRLLSSHLPYVSLPDSIKTSSKSKLVYLFREPKDNLVSLWHFATRIRPKETAFSFQEVFEMFCDGLSPFGPYWDHVLGYWTLVKEDPGRILFIKYEDLKEQPAVHLRRMAEFLDCPFSEDEVEAGMVEHILELTSFENMSRLEVNKNGKRSNGVANSAFYRKGEVGDWKNHLSAEMAQRIDQITQQRFFGSGLLM